VVTRALRLVLARGFELPGVEVVQWKAPVGNWPSRRVAERCGFRMVSVVRGLLEQRGERVDGWIGSLRRGEPLTGKPADEQVGVHPAPGAQAWVAAEKTTPRSP
jgi:RimJ/RimL family protein N-acetyltransferase